MKESVLHGIVGINVVSLTNFLTEWIIFLTGKEAVFAGRNRADVVEIGLAIHRLTAASAVPEGHYRIPFHLCEDALPRWPVFFLYYILLQFFKSHLIRKISGLLAAKL